MKPVNKYYLIKILVEKREEIVVIPETSKKKFDKYVRVKVLDRASDCKFNIETDSCLVVFGNMIEKFEFEGKQYHMIPESAILGIYSDKV